MKRSTESAAGLIVVILFVTFWIAFAYGWINNIVDIYHMAVANTPVTTMFIMRIIGVLFAPLGAILGYIG